MSTKTLLKVFLDADVLFRAVTASHQYTASLLVLRLSEFTLVEAMTAVHTMYEAARNLDLYLPDSSAELFDFIGPSLRIVDNPSKAALDAVEDQAHWKDAVNLAAAISAEAHIFVTHNVSHYYPASDGLHVMTPGQLVAGTREMMHARWGGAS